MHPLQIKAKIKLVIEHNLYEKPAAAYRRRLDELIVKDAVSRRDGNNCFVHRGVNYVKSGERASTRIFPRLSKENRDAMDAFLAEWLPVWEVEKPQVGAYIAHVLNTSDDPKHYLRKFPDSIRSYLDTLYAVHGISLDELPFAQAEPEEPVWKEPYRLLCIRLTTNLLLE